MHKTWRILSIDGGGTRGIIPVTILAYIEERTQKPISQLFDLIAGTSTGGILALGLTKPNKAGKPEFTAQDLCSLYEQEIPNIFRNPQSWWGNLLGPKYTSFGFQDVLKNAFGTCRLKEALTNVLIPCYDIEHRAPYVFKSRLAKERFDFDFQMRDVAIAASSSPTLFYPVRIPRTSAVGRPICLVDGGVFANNPTISAFSEIKSMSETQDDKCFIVSIGTGKSTRPLTDEWISLFGYVQWSRPMLELVMESISESVHEQMKNLLTRIEDQNYHRLQVDLPEHINPAIDNATTKNMQAFNTAAKEFCSDNHSGQELDTICKTLLRMCT